MNDKKMTVLAIAPHPDDVELSCGATIAKLIEKEHDVHYLVLSPCNKSLPEGYKKYQLFTELEEATKVLGLEPNRLYKEDFPVREFPRYRQDILERLVELKKDINPDMVLIPNSNDLHQDHKTTFEEGMRAFKLKKILGYELLWNNDNFKNNFFVPIEKSHLEIKKRALSSYKSQAFRGYFNDEFLYGMARVRGVQSGYTYAEAFELLRWVWE